MRQDDAPRTTYTGALGPTAQGSEGRDIMSLRPILGTHYTGKTGKMGEKNPCQGKHRRFGNFAKAQGILFAQVVHFLILKVNDNLIFAVKISYFI